MARHRLCGVVHQALDVPCTERFGHRDDHVHQSESGSLGVRWLEVRWPQDEPWLALAQGELTEEVLDEVARLKSVAPPGEYVADIDDTWTGKLLVGMNRGPSTDGTIVPMYDDGPHVAPLIRYLCAAGTVLPRLMLRLGETEAENDRLREAMVSKLAPRLDFLSFPNPEGAMEMRFAGDWASAVMCQAFRDSLDGVGAKNHLEVTYRDTDGSVILVTVHRPEGETPGAMIKRLKAELAISNGRLAMARQKAEEASSLLGIFVSVDEVAAPLLVTQVLKALAPIRPLLSLATPAPWEAVDDQVFGPERLEDALDSEPHEDPVVCMCEEGRDVVEDARLIAAMRTLTEALVKLLPEPEKETV